jgi:hypothetical protein
MEKLFYEIKPYFCVVFGSWAMHTYFMHPTGILPAAILILCGNLMLAMRLEYRVLAPRRRFKRRHYD